MGVVAGAFCLAILLALVGPSATSITRAHHRTASVASANRRKSTVLWTAHRRDDATAALPASPWER